MKTFVKLIKVGLFLVLGAIVAVVLSEKVVQLSASDKVFSSVKEVPKNKVGLLLGTGKNLKSGRINLYYKYRIEAAEQLFKEKKVKYILVSGDNGRKDYDEPSTIKEDLIAKGIPADKIYLDYAGFRTLDSVVRCKEIFGQESITVISQQFHNERAIFIADKKGINAVGFNAQDVGKRFGFKTRLREKFARVKMVLDLLFNKKPKFLGEKINIG